MTNFKVVLSASFTVDSLNSSDAVLSAQKELADEIYERGVSVTTVRRLFGANVEEVEDGNNTKVPEYFEWTKRLGQRHYAEAGFSTTTLCGMPMLGNNFASVMNEEEKTDCKVCVQKMQMK